MNLLIYCAGGLGREVLDLAQRVDNWGSRWEQMFFVDDVVEEDTICGISVYSYEEIKEHEKLSPKRAEFIIATGEPFFREKLFEKVKADGYSFATIVAPTCIISESTRIGQGCVIRDYCQISVDVEIEEGCYLQGSVHIGHDCRCKRHSVLSSMVHMAGGVVVGERAYLSPGTLVKNEISIGDDAIVGMGSVVLRNVKPGKIVRGNPAKVIGDNEEKRVFSMFS